MSRKDQDKKVKKDLDAYTQVAESMGTGTGDISADEHASMDVTGPHKGGPEGENRPDWNEPGVDTGGGMDLTGDTASGGNWGDSTGLSSNAAGPGSGDWVSGDADTGSGRGAG